MKDLLILTRAKADLPDEAALIRHNSFQAQIIFSYDFFFLTSFKHGTLIVLYELYSCDSLIQTRCLVAFARDSMPVAF